MIRLSSTILLTLACWAGSLHGQTRFSFAEGKEYHPSFGRLRDTLFVLDSSYLEVRLDRQIILHHFRSGRIDTYPCSTGTPTITDGIATRPGIFSVQSKAKKTMSQEFQVYLNYWMGFDGGIGFHGLDGRSYYRFLGKRPS
ncbi:MAG: L,D-transpeptidase, partial [Candidatus Kapaibacterium sp.]